MKGSFDFGALFKKENLGTLIVVLIVLALAIGAAVFFYSRYQEEARKSQLIISDTGLGGDKQAKALIEEIGKIVELPKDETPQIATVSDVEKLRNQPFFAHAQDGDKVLIYQKAKRAFLYRPTTRKVIEITTLNPTTPTQQPLGAQTTGTPRPSSKLTPSSTPTPTPTSAPTTSPTKIPTPNL